MLEMDERLPGATGVDLAKALSTLDAGVIEGTLSVEPDELAAAHERIAQLDAELALTQGCLRAVR